MRFSFGVIAANASLQFRGSRSGFIESHRRVTRVHFYFGILTRGFEQAARAAQTHPQPGRATTSPERDTFPGD